MSWQPAEVSANLVIFDCDGVLIDSELIACRSCAACLAEIGIPITADEIVERYVGTSASSMFADLEARFGSPFPPAFFARLRQHQMTAFAAGLVAMPGVAAAIAALASRVCVASSSTPERLRYTLSLVGLLHHFDPHVFSATQVERSKPAPDLLLFAASRMGVAPASCLVVEDSVPGVMAAVAAGMRVIGFTGGSHCGADHADRLRKAGAAQTISRLGQLPAVIP